MPETKHAIARARNIGRTYDTYQRTVFERAPRHLFDEVNREFHFTLDAAADRENALCDRFFTKEDNALLQAWAPETVWCNPPYGRKLRDWIWKAQLESQRGATVVLLVPASTDLGWWHDIVLPFAAEIRFIRGRLRYGADKGLDVGRGAFFPSCLVVFRP